MITTEHFYGEPCFVNNSTRSITIHQEGDEWAVYYRTTYAQGFKTGKGDPDEGVLSIFEELMSKLNKEDKRLFRSYFKKQL